MRDVNIITAPDDTRHLPKLGAEITSTRDVGCRNRGRFLSDEATERKESSCASTNHESLFLPFLAGSMLLVFHVPRADAIPAFARLHKTSCQTCHTGFPKLNPFGEAFRLNGYRMPGEMQPEEKPQSLGAEASKKMWPKAIWPSDIPAHIPLALNIKMAKRLRLIEG